MRIFCTEVFNKYSNNPDSKTIKKNFSPELGVICEPTSERAPSAKLVSQIRILQTLGLGSIIREEFNLTDSSISSRLSYLIQYRPSFFSASRIINKYREGIHFSRSYKNTEMWAVGLTNTLEYTIRVNDTFVLCTVVNISFYLFLMNLSEWQ